MDQIKWGGSGIEKVLYNYIVSILPPGKDKTVVELGGGQCSTQCLGSTYKLFTVEHDKKWFIYPKLTTYIHAELKDSDLWYNADQIIPFLPKKIDLLFVDGPIGSERREGILEYISMFKHCAHIIFHDTWRDQDASTASIVASKLNRNIKFYNNTDYWAHLTLKNNKDVVFLEKI